MDPIKQESSRRLGLLVDYVKMHLRSLEASGELTNSWDSLIIYLVSSKLDFLQENTIQ